MVTIKEATEKYLRDESVGLASKSVQTYAQGIARFTEHLERSHIALTSECPTLSADHALECARELSERGIAKSTLRTYISAIANFYSWLLLNDHIDMSARDVKRMQVMFKKFRKGGGERLPKLPTDEDVNALLTAARIIDSTKRSASSRKQYELRRLRNIAMIEALRISGMRVGELVGMKRGDLDYHHSTARVIGKGDKQGVVYFDKPSLDAIRKYLSARNDGASGRLLDELPVFAQHGKRGANKILPLSTHGVRIVFRQLIKDSGIERKMTPHWLRHLFATKVLDETGDLAVVQEMMRHQSPATTRIYAKVSSKKMRAAHDKTFGDKE